MEKIKPWKEVKDWSEYNRYAEVYFDEKAWRKGHADIYAADGDTEWSDAEEFMLRFAAGFQRWTVGADGPRRSSFTGSPEAANWNQGQELEGDWYYPSEGEAGEVVVAARNAEEANRIAMKVRRAK